MARSIFGWSLPPGCSGTPFDEDHEYHALHCNKCNAFISLKPYSVKGVEQKCNCCGDPEEMFDLCPKVGKHEPHEIVLDTYCEETRVCKRCGHENKTCN
jgi:hypothetical protein